MLPRQLAFASKWPVRCEDDQIKPKLTDIDIGNGDAHGSGIIHQKKDV